MMDERYTSTYDPMQDEEQSPYEWEGYEGEEEEQYRPPGPRILWGRVIALLVLLCVAFLIGWWLAPKGISQERFDSAVAAQEDAQGEIEDLRSDNEALQNQVSDLETQVDRLRTQANETDTTTGTDEDAAAGTTEGGEAANADGDQFYTVQPGDTLAEISIQFYEDPFLADVIAEANPEITDPDKLEIGDTLTIPDRPEL